MKYQNIFIDSGASHHMSPHLECFHEIQEAKVPINLACEDRQVLITKIGTLCLEQDGNLVELHGMHYAPNLRATFLSVRELTGEGFEFHFSKENSFMRKNSVEILFSQKNGLFKVEKAIILGEAALPSSLLHKRLGHPSHEKAIASIKGSADPDQEI